MMFSTLLISQGMTHDTQFTVEELQSFTFYPIQMATFNVFTPRRNIFDKLLSTDVYVQTTEGGRTTHTHTHTHTVTRTHTHTVPDPPMDLNFTVLGASTVQLNWMPGEPRANPDNITYYVFTESGQVTEALGSGTNIIISSTNGIIPGSTQTIQVWILVPV